MAITLSKNDWERLYLALKAQDKEMTYGEAMDHYHLTGSLGDLYSAAVGIGEDEPWLSWSEVIEKALES